MQISKKRIKDLTPAEYNPRKMSDKKSLLLKRSMQEFGDLSGIVVNVRTGNTVGGHQRIKNLDPSWPIKKKKFADDIGTVALGYVDTPFGKWSYREVGWDEKKEKAANLAANKHSGSWDLNRLEIVFKDLEPIELDLELTGFSRIEIKQLGRYMDNKQDGASQLGNLEFQIVVNCDDESHQKKLLKKFEKEKIKCRPLIL